MATRRAFTMLEMMIVIGIIALLVAVLVPAASHLIEKNRANGTRANLEILGNAIESYKNCKAFGKVPPDWFSIKDVDPGPKESFIDTNLDGRWQSGETINDDDGDGIYCANNIRESIPGISPKSSFHPIVRLPGNTPDIYTAAQVANTQDFKHIETFYLYITQLCPEGAAILKRLPPKVVTNKDLCSGVECPDLLVLDTNGNGTNDTPYNEPGKDKTIEMMELRDDWGQPLSYQVETFGRGTSAHREWEIRSAGADGVMESAFTPSEDSKDDIILRGQ